MKLHSLAYLSVRVLAIYLFILGLRHMVNLLDYTVPTYMKILDVTASSIDILLIVSTPTLVFFIGGILLWVFAGRLSRFLVLQTSSESENVTDGKEIEGFVLSVVGLVLLILSFSRFAGSLLNYINNVSQDIQFTGFNARNYWFSMAEQFIRMIIGVVLIYKAKGLAHYLGKFRGLGLNHLNKDT